jgi:hypothetical protein
MPLTLNPLGSDNFTRANENPLSQSGNWVTDSFGEPALQIVSDVCEGTAVDTDNNVGIYSGVSLPNDQYASMMLVAKPSGVESSAQAGIRVTDNGSAWGNNLPSYVLTVGGNNVWFVNAGTSTIMSGSGLTISAGDVFTIAAVGTTVYAFQNSTQLGSVTNTTYAAGKSGLANFDEGQLTNVRFSNWVVGSAATATFSISGNAGVAGATVSWSDTSTGSTTADGSGNYSITGLSNGSYVVTPSLAGYTFSPTSQNETVSGSNISGVNFTATPTSIVAGASATLTPAYGPIPVQVFGQISSGANAGKIAAVATDSNGNLAISGGSGGSVNTIDVLGAIADGVPCMIYGNPSTNATEPGSTALVAVAVDQFGNILASIGSGGGNTSTTVDTPKASSTGVTFVQVFGRDPAGNVVGVPASSTGALGDTINPISNVPITITDERSTANQFPVPVILCGRVASGPNAGAIVAVALDATGALCVSGSSGSSSTPNQVQTFNNGECALIQLYGRNSSGQLVSVPLTTAGSVLLN